MKSIRNDFSYTRYKIKEDINSIVGYYNYKSYIQWKFSEIINKIILEFPRRLRIYL